MANDLIPASVQGTCFAMVWERNLIRRTYASRIPFDNPKTIGDRLPRVYPLVIETELREDEYETCAAREEMLLQRLIYKDRRTGKPKRSFATLRKLSLLCMWFDFHYVESAIKAKSVTAWLEKPHYLWEWLYIIYKRKQQVGAPMNHLLDKPDAARTLAYLCRSSPKLRAFLKMVGDHVVRDQEKALIWCSYPATQLPLFGVLQLLNIDSRIYTANLDQKKRNAVVEDLRIWKKVQ